MSDRADDYLWDGSGPVDPDVVALQQHLRSLAHDGRPLVAGPRRAPSARPWRWLAAAALVLLAVSTWWLRGAAPELAPGSGKRRFAADDGARTIALGKLATIELRRDSELWFVHWRADQALFALERGSIAVTVQPPPAVPLRFFQVDTALGRVIDEGCRFELTRRGDEAVTVAVQEGAVSFAAPAGSRFVPAGASLTIDPRGGPRTPIFDEAPPDLRRAVTAWDEAVATGADAGALGQAFKNVLRELERGDDRRNSLILWHLLAAPDEFIRREAEFRLLQTIGGPDAKVKDETWEPQEWLARLRIAVWADLAPASPGRRGK